MMCREVTELLTEAMEGCIPADKKAAFAFHIAICPYCKAHRHQVEKTIATVSQLPAPSPTEDARAQALAAFRRIKRGGGEGV